MKKIIASLSLLVASFSMAQNSCYITVDPTYSTICPGDSVLVVVDASLLPAGQTFNFNGSTLPTGWSTTGTTYFSSPCGPSIDGTPYYWAATSGSATPTITTATYDISCPGGTVQFDMIYSVQGGPVPCEGPDQQNEGVQLQYSTDGGVTWILIAYYEPDGQTLNYYNTSPTTVIGTDQQTVFTSWATYTVPIPAGANSPNTEFRWIQVASSSSSNDNWGLDNVIINAYGGTCSDTYGLVWSNGITADSAYITTYADTTFTIDVFDTLGNYQCTSAPVQIVVYPDNLTYTAIDTVYSACPTTNPEVTVSNITSAHGPYTINWPEIPSTNTTVNLSTNGAEHDTLFYHFTVEDGCHFTRTDSVVLIVNKTLNIDSMEAFPASACNNDGAVVAFVSGETITNVQPYYNWNGPGATNPSFINATTWENLSSGWYYFMVQDAVCTDNDSVFVDQLPPPSASVDASPQSGCAPFTTTLSNNSQNANQYYWDFGNGQTLFVTNTSSQTQTYSNTATIMLVASMDGDCPDTAYVTISSAVCGCTDSTALNYNPLATINDGSCKYKPAAQPSVIVPNIFTPNGDGANDVFEITGTNVTSISFTILNRWGDIVFDASPAANPTWDGKDKNGAKVNDGVYFVVYKVVGLSPDLTLDGQGFVEIFSK